MRSDLTATKRQATKRDRREASEQLTEYLDSLEQLGPIYPETEAFLDSLVGFGVAIVSKPDNVHSNER
jgi:hypothetical protein